MKKGNGILKIVSWNCAGKFREKYKVAQELDADIYVIQECENPRKVDDENYNKFADNYLWCGENKNKGLGIFANRNISIENNNWKSHYLRCFISAKINKDFNLLGVWACKSYIEEYCVFQSIHYAKFNEEMIILGDFNSNKKWDKKHSRRGHSHVVSRLRDKGLTSAYHHTREENHGNESKNTFYMHRDPSKGYHIDYAFLNKDKIKGFNLLNDTIWLNYSDHVPIVLEVD